MTLRRVATSTDASRDLEKYTSVTMADIPVRSDSGNKVHEARHTHRSRSPTDAPYQAHH
jgi:hypothetical protein